jgi:hypothetical protein
LRPFRQRFARNRPTVARLLRAVNAGGEPRPDLRIAAINDQLTGQEQFFRTQITVTAMSQLRRMVQQRCARELRHLLGHLVALRYDADERWSAARARHAGWLGRTIRALLRRH